MKSEKSFSRREFLLMSSVATASTLLAACAPAQPAEEVVEEEPEEETTAPEEPAEEEPEEAAPPAEAVELSLMMVDYTDETKTVLEEEIIPAYTAEHEGNSVTVNYTDWGRYNEEMTTAFAGGVTPDVFQGGAVWAPQMAKRGWSLPLDDYIASASPDWEWDDYFPALQDDVTIDGSVVAVPYRIDIRSFWYRQDHLSEAGFDEPPTNWEELEETAIACTKREGGQIVQEGFHYSGAGGNWQNDLQPYMYFMEMAGGTYLSDDLSRCTLSDDPAVEALEFVRKLIVEDKVQPYPGFEQQGNLGAFEFGLAAMTMGGGTIERNAIQYAPEQLEHLVVTLPLKHKVQATHVWVNKFFISKLTKTPDVSWGFLEHLTSKPMAEKYCASAAVTPPRKSLGEAEFMTDRMKILLQCTEYAHPYPKHWRLIELFRPFATALEKCLRGEQTPTETMAEACEGIDAILAEG